ncbi:hypothetical protein [Methylorubrum sp. SB2]|uniref:hypothetical protein n=1 Tax=Methylorubrum subtropicum TaxID=3138812 RepID=UPI00313E1E79
MKIILISAVCAAFISTATHAQPASQAVGFYVLGVLPNGNSSNTVVVDGKSATYTGSFGNPITIEQLTDCTFRMYGIDFFKDVRKPIDVSIDFSDFANLFYPLEPQRYGDRIAHMLPAANIKVCSKLIHEEKYSRKLPNPGECRDVLYTEILFNPSNDGIMRRKNALKYVKEKFCRGSAF